ncbi:MAG: alpha-L-fucosidase [Bacteroidales bacterium]|jgi:alpha-L-fucosidase|nr:alpha-L-fucosidase [Bacteroidales bacterium]
MKRTFFLIANIFVFVVNALSQSVLPTDACAETDERIIDKIEQWQDLKFGFMVHWGMYSQWGIVESWSVCNEPWISRNGKPYDDYKKEYFSLNKTFNPENFNPDKWAEIAEKAGMKYFVFTTKHHDGFCMFNTKQTDFSIVNKQCPYSVNEKADITGELVKSFRKKNFWTGLYFSKPDWHNEDYWSPLWATPDRNVNYNIEDFPDKWERFCNFTYEQIKELTTQYDPDILWLDGGWIRPVWSLNEETAEWLGCYKRIQDINMSRIAIMARETNPELIIVDRSVGGKYENYHTPEKKVPDSVLLYPWETCMTMGESWSYVPDDNYKSVNTLIHLLIDIVAKGGNLLLNVGPDAQGELPPQAIQRMEAIGEWLSLNGQAIYATKPVFPYKEGNICYTQSKKNGQIYAIYLLEENEMLPEKIVVNKNGEIKKIKISRKQQKQSKCSHAVVFPL